MPQRPKTRNPTAYAAVQLELDPIDRELLCRFVFAVQKIAAAMGSGHRPGGMTDAEKAELAADAAAITAKIEAASKSLDDEVERIKGTK